MKRTIIILTVLVALVSCHKQDAFPEQNRNEIKFEFGIATKATATAFETGDQVAVYAVEYASDEAPELQIAGNFLHNEKLTFNGTSWIAAKTLYWSEKPCDFYALYPYQSLVSVEDHAFEIATDQNSAEGDGVLGGYEASDLLFAKAEKVSHSDGKVALQFKHMMSRVVVKLERGEKYEGELPEDITVHLYNTVTTAEVDLTKGSLQRYGNGEKKTITMKQLSGDTFAAIVVPQNIERRTPLVEVTMDGIAYLLSYSTSFRPGYQHTITVTLNTSPDQEKIEIELDGDIDDWN
jgi:hypothetical protein